MYDHGQFEGNFLLSLQVNDVPFQKSADCYTCGRDPFLSLNKMSTSDVSSVTGPSCTINKCYSTSGEGRILLAVTKRGLTEVQQVSCGWMTVGMVNINGQVYINLHLGCVFSPEQCLSFRLGTATG